MSGPQGATPGERAAAERVAQGLPVVPVMTPAIAERLRRAFELAKSGREAVA